MRQGVLLDTINPEPVRHPHHVPSTSRAAFLAAINNELVTKRGLEVLEWLLQWTDQHGDAPTSAELTRWFHRVYPNWSYDRLLVHVRRALADLNHGLVEHATARVCTVAGTKALTWRVCRR